MNSSMRNSLKSNILLSELLGLRLWLSQQALSLIGLNCIV